ncbi:DEAD/DEAH box helicase [Dietzia cinnamea]|uniref:DEAD/DEAH box helicase n=1 Tax=Dietzia cinnamea TaxID=321318 RepID=UPI003D092FDF
MITDRLDTRDDEQRPDVDATLGTLKDFQRATVEHVVNRLWLDDDRTDKFLVADEVGLGKTLVAKGVIAKTIDHLWEDVPRIDIVYICSNAQIANQNLSHLSKVSEKSFAFSKRLTMLATELGKLEDQKVNFVSFTPGTSFNLKSRGGQFEERVLLYWLVARTLGRDVVRPTRWYRFFEGAVDRDSFRDHVDWFDPDSIDDTVAERFEERVRSQPGPDGGPLLDEVQDCVQKFNYLRGKPNSDLSRRRYALIGRLRTELAHASVDALEPDLVILDEFQRFKDLLATEDDEETEASTLAKAVFEYPGARTLLLSATPYKMYTLPDEPEGDDHYADFIRTVRFLAGPEVAQEVAHQLRVLRETLVSGGDPEKARAARGAAEALLRTVMCRTERLAATTDRDGMLREHSMPGVQVTADDIRGWRSFDTIASAVDRHDVFEYWRSTPYPLNIMERGHYRINQHFTEALERQNAVVVREVTRGEGFLSWKDIASYRELDAGNAKIRGLIADVLDKGVWKLAWLPPTLPYHRLSGPYSESELPGFTKRLVFSAWDVVPKAISVMLSYEAERRSIDQAGGPSAAYDQRQVTQPLQFRMDETRPAAMSLLSLMYPSVTLARLGDPLSIARELDTFDADSAEVLALVRTKLRSAIAELEIEENRESRADPSWYWALPLLLDRHHKIPGQDEFEEDFGELEHPDDKSGGQEGHLSHFVNVDTSSFGRIPDDVDEVLAEAALASPANTALRALSRVCGGTAALSDESVRHSAFTIANDLRLMLNKPDLVTLLRTEESAEPYWRSVLHHGIQGCLQAVLDEYVHGLVESRSLQDRDVATRAGEIVDAFSESLGLKTVHNTIEDFDIASDGSVRPQTRRVRLNIASRFGRATAEDGSEQREASVRVAFNSPFRPFVLASTSVGQEGLDFHTYCHAVVHWNLPGNPVDLEQREGRVHRYKGHAVRKNVARRHREAALRATVDDPWFAMFLAAEDARGEGENELTPYWVYPDPEGAAIERYVPAMPLSKEVQKYRRLMRTVGGYRMVIGQPRQEDLLRYLGERDVDVSSVAIDLRPPPVAGTGTPDVG